MALRGERDAPVYRETLQNLLIGIDRMTGTVRGLFQLTRAEMIVKRPEEQLDLSALVTERTDRTRQEAEAKGLMLYAHIESSVTVGAEPAPLAEVVDNLLTNAVKYTPPAGVWM